MEVEGRSVKCQECEWKRDRDHNAATNLANAVLSFLDVGQWPAPLDYQKAKNYDDNNNNNNNNDA